MANRLFSLSISTGLLVALTGIAASIGCSTPAPTDLGSGDSDLTDEKPAAKKKAPAKKPATAATGTTSSSGAAPVGTGEDEDLPPSRTSSSGGTSSSSSSSSGASSSSSSGGPGGDGEACFVQCIAKDPKAVQIDKCEMGCQDETCAQGCLSKGGCSSEDNCPALDTLEQCAQQCGLDQGGDPNQGQGQGQGDQF